MTLYCGIDLHSNNSLIALIDESDHITKAKRLPNDINTINEYLAPYQDDLAGGVVESTDNWYWLVEA